MVLAAMGPPAGKAASRWQGHVRSATPPCDYCLDIMEAMAAMTRRVDIQFKGKKGKEGKPAKAKQGRKATNRGH